MILPPETRTIDASINDAAGRLQIRDAAFYRSETTSHERGLYCVRNGAYIMPTTELIGFLRYVIGGRSAIEIGSGNGVLAAAIGIQATDSFQQEDPSIARLYAGLGQATVPYGRAVQKLRAQAAIDLYEPKVVVAAWVTHVYDASQHHREGNEAGVDEAAVIGSCETYLFIGNRHVHRHKPIWDLPHAIIEPDWLFSRAQNGSPDFIAIFGDRARWPV